jgi:tRNA 2-thiouridine synthesizing protein A
VASSAAEWNAGELGCGELVLELRNRLAAMKPGERLELVALDPGAPADIPAWCRMTGHTLVSTQHPVYLIQRKED